MMTKDSRVRIDKELGVIDKIVPKIIPDNSEIVPYLVGGCPKNHILEKCHNRK